MTRDEKADYIAAYIAEYESYLSAGNSERAEQVAAILRDHYGHEVAAPDSPERADEKAPEQAVPEKPRRGRRPLPRDEDGNIVRGKE